MSIPLLVAPEIKPRSSARSDSVVKSAARVLQILEFFDRRRSAANAHAVSVALGYPHSGTSALLRSLVATGYLQYDRGKRLYSPTLRVALMGAHWIAPKIAGDGVLPRLMEVLARRGEGTVVLAARNGDIAEFVHVTGVRAEEVAPGDGCLLTDPGVGQVLLSALPEEEVRGLLHRLNSAAIRNGMAVLRPADVLVKLSEIRRSGYAESENGSTGLVAAALPIRVRGEPYAVAMVLPLSQFAGRRMELAALLREEISRHLGAMKPVLRWPTQEDTESLVFAGATMSLPAVHHHHAI